jgi:glycosyltransferase involved in cell wall biosynthesis
MRVLMVAPEFPPGIGGMQAHAGETAARLAARGHHVLVLTEAANRSRQEDGPIDIRPVLGRNARAAAGSIRRAARDHASDVILLMNAGFAPIVTGSRSDLPPVVVRTAGNDAYGAWHGPRLPLRFLFWRLPHGRPGSLGSILRRVDQERRAAAVLSALSRCDRILCNSSYVLGRLRDLGVTDARLHLMVGGVDTEFFRPVAPEKRCGPQPEGAATLGIAGHLLPVKGIDVALRMMALAGSPLGSTILRVAGSGPESRGLQDLARSLNVAGRVEFLGSQSPAGMLRFYQGLDLYLQPSVEVRHESSGIVQVETMGRAICEAAACEVPVVASRTGGIPDVVENGVTGRLVPGGDPQALAAAVVDLLASPPERRRLGEAGRRLAVDRFSWEAVVRETERHLEEARRGRR